MKTEAKPLSEFEKRGKKNNTQKGRNKRVVQSSDSDEETTVAEKPMFLQQPKMLKFG